MPELLLNSHTHDVSLDVQSSEPFLGIEPDSLFLAWVWRPLDGRWKIRVAEVSGQVFRQDGTPGLRRLSLSLLDHSYEGRGGFRSGTPAWVLEAAATHSPKEI